MSPGSYMSSESAVESAGSSNSIDDTEIGYGMKCNMSFFHKITLLNSQFMKVT